MTLTKHVYVRRWNDETGQIEPVAGINVEDIDPKKVTYIVEEAGYWRKANAIHRWFVEHVQDGEDDCRSYWVDSKQLQQLLETVERVLGSVRLVDGQVKNDRKLVGNEWKPVYAKAKVLADPSLAQELLPTQSGLFFGSTNYDSWYVKDLRDTVEILRRALSDTEGSEFYYQSSW